MKRIQKSKKEIDYGNMIDNLIKKYVHADDDDSDESDETDESETLYSTDSEEDHRHRKSKSKSNALI